MANGVVCMDRVCPIVTVQEKEEGIGSQVGC